MLAKLPIESVFRRADARAVDDGAISGLVDSIAEIGLINPIRVRSTGERWEVIAGAHRLEACKRLGLADIDAVIVTDDDLHAELAMIDENLCRAELSPSERAVQTARRKAIYLELHPETAQHVAGGHAKNNPASENFSFAAETAKATGQNERTVQLHAERGEKVIPEVIDLITGTKLDTGSYLDKLKKLSPNDQVTAANRDLGALRRNETEAKRRAKDAKLQADVKARAAKEVADILAEHVPGDWWDSLKANLYAAGAKNVADAFTNITGHSVMDRSAA